MKRFYRLFEPSGDARRDWLLLWALAGLTLIVVMIFQGFLLPSIEPETSSSFFTTFVAAREITPLKALVSAPLSEEIIFRAWLVSSNWFLLAGGAICFLVIQQILVGGVSAMLPAIWEYPLIGLGIVGAYKGWKALPKANGLLVTCGLASTVVFALYHIHNPEQIARFGSNPSLMTALIAVLPQLVLGFFCMVNRVRVGLLGAMALHCAWNAEAVFMISFPMAGVIVLMALIICKIAVVRQYWRFL
jgi:membrane protease YdiL (CAAX protease family)